MNEEALLHTAPITADELIAFLDAKSGKSVCAACGEDDFGILNSEKEGVWLFSIETVNTGGEFHFPSYGTYCINCGLARHHSSVIVDNWVRQYRTGTTDLPQEKGVEDE